MGTPRTKIQSKNEKLSPGETVQMNEKEWRVAGMEKDDFILIDTTGKTVLMPTLAAASMLEQGIIVQCS